MTDNEVIEQMILVNKQYCLGVITQTELNDTLLNLCYEIIGNHLSKDN